VEFVPNGGEGVVDPACQYRYQTLAPISPIPRTITATRERASPGGVTGGSITIRETRRSSNPYPGGRIGERPGLLDWRAL
jgi:hypothetical protein